MKVVGIFRGFPGLGRVVSGIEVLEYFRRQHGAEVLVFTYGCGKSVVEAERIPQMEDLEHALTIGMITGMGLNPIAYVPALLIERIVHMSPDLVVIDGEPLMTMALSLVYPRDRLISLLNPYDIENPHLPESTIAFYRKTYLSAGRALVHGANHTGLEMTLEDQCHVVRIPTIVRSSVCSVCRVPEKVITCVLGGGSQYASEEFVMSTIEIGKRCVELGQEFPDYKIVIFSNELKVYCALEQQVTGANVIIFKGLGTPVQMYSKARVVLIRGGRNAIGELLYLGIPMGVFVVSDRYRGQEQRQNVEVLRRNYESPVELLNVEDSIFNLTQQVHRLLESKSRPRAFIPGNSYFTQVFRKERTNGSV